jgi:hypothetical protein
VEGPHYIFSFDELREGKLGLSAVYGSFLVEGAACCLHKNGHHSPGSLVLTVEESLMTSLIWKKVGAELDSTWADLKEAAEYGAYAVAIVVCLKLTNFPRVGRCAQEGTGIDIWVTDDADERGIFQRAARLEVSGILRDDQNRTKARLKQKHLQTKRSDETTLPAYVAVVEFGSPEIRMQKRYGRGQQ